MPIAPAREKIKPLRPNQKVQPAREILARKPSIPREGRGPRGALELGDSLTWGTLSGAKNHPAIARRNGAFPVEYLGFRAEIFLNRCTNCSRKTSPILLLPLPPIGESRRRAPSPPPPLHSSRSRWLDGQDGTRPIYNFKASQGKAAGRSPSGRRKATSRQPLLAQRSEATFMPDGRERPLRRERS